VQLSVQELAAHSQLNFTRRYEGPWEGSDHLVTLGHVALEHALAPIG
jgi:hypothetical protein